MYNIIGYTHIDNYYYIFKIYTIVNTLSICDYLYFYINETFIPDTRIYNPIYKIYNPITNLSKNGMYFYLFFLISSNILMYFDICIYLNLLYQYHYYYILVDVKFLKDSHHRILKYVTFIFLISPYFYNTNEEYVPSYGLFFINYKLINVYLSAGITKIKTIPWIRGHAIMFILCSSYSTLNGFVIPKKISEILCYFTLFWELFGFTFLMNKDFFFIGLIIGILFHIGLFIFMRPIAAYQITMIFLIFSYYNFTNKYSDLQLNFISSLIIILFCLLQVINDSVQTDSFLRNKYITKFFDVFRINDHKVYELFGDKFSIIDIVTKLVISEINNKNYEIILNINKHSQHCYMMAILGEYDNSEDDYKTSKILKNSIISKYKNENTISINMITNIIYLTDNILKYDNIYGNIEYLHSRYNDIIDEYVFNNEIYQKF